MSHWENRKFCWYFYKQEHKKPLNWTFVFAEWQKGNIQQLLFFYKKYIFTSTFLFRNASIVVWVKFVPLWVRAHSLVEHRAQRRPSARAFRTNRYKQSDPNSPTVGLIITSQWIPSLSLSCKYITTTYMCVGVCIYSWIFCIFSLPPR